VALEASEVKKGTGTFLVDLFFYGTFKKVPVPFSKPWSTVLVKTIGILGCGTITERGHLPALMRTQGVGVATIYDRTIFKARDLQNKFGLKHVCESEEEFWRSDCDAVVICTPAPLHKEHVLKAARHGKHVLCEKPLAMNEADIAEMIQTMNDAGLMLFTGFTYRFSHSAHTI